MNNLKILIVGNIHYDHLARYVTHVKEICGGIVIDVFNVGDRTLPIPKAYKDIKIINHKRYFPFAFYHLKFIRRICNFIDNQIAECSVGTSYDLMNVHYVSNYRICRKSGKKISQHLMLTPWGSDILRVNPKKLNKLRHLFDDADYIAYTTTKFKQFIVEQFGVPLLKLHKLGYGSDNIDMLINNPDISREDAKTSLGIQGKYVITCGYNASPAQNHNKILDAISSVKNELTANVVVLLPMTYGGDKQYIYEVSKYAKSLNLEYIIFDKYLGDTDLLFLRKCSDMFIHAQPTDSYSGSIQEYLLCGAKVINGKWTRYAELEQYEMPYTIFNDFDELGDTIIKVFNSPQVVLSNSTIEVIKQKSWTSMAKGWAEFYNSLGR